MKPPKRSGTVLVFVLVVVVLLSLSAYTFCDLMLTEREAADVSGSQVQARSVASSGAELIRAVLMQDPDVRLAAGGVYNNEAVFRDRVVVDDPDEAFRGRFTIVSPAYDTDGLASAGLRYGLEDECARLHLNHLVSNGGTRDQLMGLPGMTEEIADAILDWIDEDIEPREMGAEADYYSGLQRPYAVRNGPLESIDELLLIRGVTPELLYGLDRNRDGIVDPHEAMIALDSETDNSDGTLDRGWSAYLTLRSIERNADSTGVPKIDLNMEDMQQLYDELSSVFNQQWATFIVAYRQNGPYTGSQAASSSSTGNLDLTSKGRTSLVQVLDMIGQKVRVRFEGADEAIVLPPTFPDDPLAMAGYLPLLMEHTTTSRDPTITGRVNINQAPRAVLLAIPGMTVEIADGIIAARLENPDSDDGSRSHETWPLVESLVTLDEMRTLLTFVTTGGDVYRAQVIGQIGDRGPTARLEVTVDATGLLPRIVGWRDISHLGNSLSPQSLRFGAPAD